MREVDKIALAAFLHDIGKFGQRAEIDECNNLDDYEKIFAVCDKNKCSYQHSAYTAKIIKDMGLDNIFDLVNLASSHHKQNLDGIEKVIQDADRFSPSERKEGESRDFKKTNLLSIFSEVVLCNLSEEFYFYSQKFNENINYSIKNWSTFKVRGFNENSSYFK